MTPHLALPTELTIYTATSTRDAWLDALSPAGTDALHAQADAVVEVDSAGLQLLVSLRHSCAAQQRELLLLQPSETLRAACTRAGLGDLLTPGAPA